jgi:xylulokinase
MSYALSAIYKDESGMYLGTNCYLGIDCGTQGTKALLIDENGASLGRGYAPHALTEGETGAREQDPAWWVEALRIAVKQALAQAGSHEVKALGVSGQQHGLVVLDEDLAVIRPAKLWNDTQTAPQNRELVELLGGKEGWFERFGIVPLTGYTVSKLLWLKQNEPENFARIRHILLPHEYLNFWLTGRLCAEFGDASGTAFFDVRSRQWSREVLDAIDGGAGQLFAALPPLIGVDEAVGTLRPEVAAELGLPESCVVSAGGGDNMMGAIGTGNVREGVVTLSLGTSSTVYSFHDAPVLDATGNVAPFCSSSGGWLPLVCTMNATNVVTQTLQTLGRTVHDIEAALSKTTTGSGGLVFLPFLNGERTPDLPDARGALSGISANNFTPENLIRAAIEGVSFGILNGLDLIQKGAPVNRILVIGGGSRSAAWRQLLADASGATVEVPVEEEAGCLGAAIQAIYLQATLSGAPRSFAEIAARHVKVEPSRSASPNPALVAAYRQARERYQSTLQTMYP